MNRYVVFLNEGYLACKAISAEKEVSYIEDGNEFFDILRTFREDHYRVKIKDGDVMLVGSHEKLVLKNYEVLREDGHLQPLIEDVEQTMWEDGFVDLTNRDRFKNRGKVNREKSNSILPLLVKASMTAALAVGIVAAIYNGGDVLKKDKNAEIPTTPRESSVVEIVEHVNSVPLSNLIDLSEPVQMVEEKMENIVEEQSRPEVQMAYLDYVDNSQTDKAKKTKELYMDYFEDCSKRFGVDANLLLAIATQERGVHSDVIDKLGGFGLMQVQYSVWIGKTIQYYELNEDTAEFEKKSLVVTDELLKDVRSNIEIGTMILQNYLKIAHYNIPAAIQMYNMGNGAVKSIMRTYAEVENKSLDDVLDNPLDMGWLQYRYLKVGDKEYLERVNQWAENPFYTVTNVDNMERVSFSFTNEEVLTQRL